MNDSASFLAEISVNSPRKSFIFIILKKPFSGSKYPKIVCLILNTEALMNARVAAPDDRPTCSGRAVVGKELPRIRE